MNDLVTCHCGMLMDKVADDTYMCRYCDQPGHCPKSGTGACR